MRYSIQHADDVYFTHISSHLKPVQYFIFIFFIIVGLHFQFNVTIAMLKQALLLTGFAVSCERDVRTLKALLVEGFERTVCFIRHTEHEMSK